MPRRIDPSALMFYTDKYQQLPNATVQGDRIDLVAVQLERPKRFLGMKKRIKNHIWLIPDAKMVVYSNKKNAIAVFKMGLSLKRLRKYAHDRNRINHPKSQTMEFYWQMFSEPHSHPNWLKRNKFSIV